MKSNHFNWLWNWIIAVLMALTPKDLNKPMLSPLVLQKTHDNMDQHKLLYLQDHDLIILEDLETQKPFRISKDKKVYSWNKLFHLYVSVFPCLLCYWTGCVCHSHTVWPPHPTPPSQLQLEPSLPESHQHPSANWQPPKIKLWLLSLTGAKKRVPKLWLKQYLPLAQI